MVFRIVSIVAPFFVKLCFGGVNMKANVGGIDKILRIVVGLALIAWVLLAGGPVWAWIGVIPLATGLFNFCPAYAMLGIKTCKTE